jgi:hypothetical protein
VAWLVLLIAHRHRSDGHSLLRVDPRRSKYCNLLVVEHAEIIRPEVRHALGHNGGKIGHAEQIERLPRMPSDRMINLPQILLEVLSRS